MAGAELGTRKSLSRRALLAGAGALPLAGCLREPPLRDAHGRPLLSVWHPWGGVQAPRIAAILHACQQAHPALALRALYTPNDLANNQKFFTSVAASKPPDVIFVDGPQVAEWAERGALQPLDPWLAREGIEPDDYFPPCWRQNHYRGRVYALTYCADPNFAFAWNRAVFRDAGLDPERPPRTIAEMDEMDDRLTRLDGGKITRIGIIPWDQFGRTNSLFTWGWVFGGSFYDDAAQRITASDPGVVRALEWMVGRAQRHDITRVSSLQQGFGSAQQDPFYIGKMAMRCLHISQVEQIRQYAPNLDYGLTFIPAPPEGEQRCSWVGGWCVALPAGARHPQEAWRVIRWLCRDDEGTEIVGRTQGLMPGYRRSPAFRSLRTFPGFEQFYRILQETRHQRPVMPAQAYYMGAIQRAVDAALYGKKSPRRALEDCTAETQAELDVVVRGA